jgi:tetratricopeptide (TPR) repeat protein
MVWSIQKWIALLAAVMVVTTAACASEPSEPTQAGTPKISATVEAGIAATMVGVAIEEGGKATMAAPPPATTRPTTSTPAILCDENCLWASQFVLVQRKVRLAGIEPSRALLRTDACKTQLECENAWETLPSVLRPFEAALLSALLDLSDILEPSPEIGDYQRDYKKVLDLQLGAVKLFIEGVEEDDTFKLEQGNEMMLEATTASIDVMGHVESLVASFTSGAIQAEKPSDKTFAQAEQHYNKGAELDGKGLHDQAILEFGQAIQLLPYFAEAYYGRAITYAKLGQYQRAIDDFDKAILIDPNFAMAYLMRGNGYYYLGQITKADADKAKACSLDSQYC